MSFLRSAARWLGAYTAAALAGYTLASVGITAHNLVRLRALGIDIDMGEAWNTIVFDFQALSPTLGTITKFGSVVWLGFLIAFGAAHLLLVSLAGRVRAPNLDMALFALAGAMAMATGIAIIDAQYKVSMISGTAGVSGYVTQLIAGALAGVTFTVIFRATAGEMRR